MWVYVLYPFGKVGWKRKTIICFNLLFSPTHKSHSSWSTTGCNVQSEYPSSTPIPQIVQLWNHSFMWSIIVPGLPTSILLCLLIIILELLMKREYGLIWLWTFLFPPVVLNFGKIKPLDNIAMSQMGVWKILQIPLAKWQRFLCSSMEIKTGAWWIHSVVTVAIMLMFKHGVCVISVFICTEWKLPDLRENINQ